MMQVHTIICDDDEIQCQNLRAILKEIRPEYAITIVHSGEELLEIKQEPNLIFLDIEMSGMDGMETAKELRSRDYQGEIIFLTFYPEFMQDAFEVRAFRYLQKPPEKDKLSEILDSLEYEWSRNQNKKIIIEQYGDQILLDVNDIIYIHAEKRGTSIHTGNKVYESMRTIKEWVNEFGETDFFQVHKSYLVSLDHIEKIQSTSVILKYTEKEIPISRRRVKEFREFMYDHVRKHARKM